MAARGRAWRAARSLHWNRFLLELVEARIERAEVALLSHLALSGESRLEVGSFTLELEDGEIQVTRRPDLPSAQMELPEPDGHELSPEEVLDQLSSGSGCQFRKFWPLTFRKLWPVARGPVGPQ